MRKAAADLEFEEAGRLRDEIRRLEADELGLPTTEARAGRRFHRGQAGHAEDAIRQSAAEVGAVALRNTCQRAANLPH